MLPIQIISAPSILGLKPTGVEKLSESLLSNGLRERLHCLFPTKNVETFNQEYSSERDKRTFCLNPDPIERVSKNLATCVGRAMEAEQFPLVLGGDCSILIGIFAALKSRADYGLLFCDAHADFYAPQQSLSGEVADMDLSIITGRGPDILSNIDEQKPYVPDKHVIHIGQRDWHETKKYGSQDIRETEMAVFDYDMIRTNGIASVLTNIIDRMNYLKLRGFWIHFDTDVVADDENPAVDYRLPGGLSFDECKRLLTALMATNKIIGMSVTIFNPNMDDEERSISRRLTDLLVKSLQDGSR